MLKVFSGSSDTCRSFHRGGFELRLFCHQVEAGLCQGFAMFGGASTTRCQVACDLPFVGAGPTWIPFFLRSNVQSIRVVTDTSLSPIGLTTCKLCMLHHASCKGARFGGHLCVGTPA